MKLKLVLFVKRLYSICTIYLVFGNTSLPIAPRRWFTPSLPVSVITEIHYSLVSRRNLLKCFKWYKIVLQDWHLTKESSRMLLLFLLICIGSPSNNALSSKFWLLYTRRSVVSHRVILPYSIFTTL